MKENLKIIAGALCMTILIGVPQTIFAADNTSAEEENSASEEFYTSSMELSLEEAYELFQKSDTYELVELQNESDSATIKSYSEQISTNNETIENAKEGTSSSSAKNSNNILKERRTYANALIESNKAARENAAYQEFVNQYYNLKSAEKNLEIQEKSLALKKEAMELAELKYEYGSVSKLDVLSSQISYKQAENSYQSALNAFEIAKMEFNDYLGLALDTELTLTSELEEVALPEISLESAIESALENRVEFVSAEYALAEAKRSFGSVSAYPSSSATYLNGKINYTKAQIDYDAVENDVIIDVTEKYTQMQEKYEAVQTDKMNLESAEESLSLAMSRYELGMSTLTEVQSAQLTLDNAESSYANDLLSYLMAVKNFELAAGAGTSTAAL